MYLGDGGISTTELINMCRDLAAIGIQHVIFSMPNSHEISPLEAIGRTVIPAVAKF